DSSCILVFMKGKSFVWTEEAESAFQVVKEKLTTAPILVLPDFSKVFELHTDALKVAIGGVLSQYGRPVAYFSKKLMHIRTQDKVLHKHGRWLAFLEKFTYVVKHKTDVSNRAADAFSRRSNLLVSMQVDVPGLDVILPKGTTTNACLYMPLPVPMQPWVDISMNFMLGVVYSAQPHGPLDLMSLPVFGSVPKKVQDFLKGLLGEYSKLSAKKIRPLEIVKKINSNAYHLKLPCHIHCFDVFNVKHLLPYHGDSSDDDLVVNSRANFVYIGGNDAGPSIEEWVILFLEAQDHVKKSLYSKGHNLRSDNSFQAHDQPFRSLE
ncbi:putative reverse transcriptase domain-containing protein, partial [Tanacetum coccineum]